MYSKEEPDFDEVNRFRSDPINFPVTALINKPPVLTRVAFDTIRDQIIRGWVYKEATVGLKPFVKTFIIPEFEQNYPGFEWYDATKTYGVVYVKGHGLEKKLFFEWSSDVVFYCPKIFQDGTNLVAVKKEIEIVGNPVGNRFFKDEVFHYLDQRRKFWISFPFGELDTINNRFKSLAEGSYNCERTKAINRI
ncbi:hypothetical protein GCM10028805_48670 [Spirosoma harenae]